MSDISWYFFLGTAVSFIGSIPIGAINLNVIKTSLVEGFRPALFFSFGATLIEFFYSFIAIQILDFIPDLHQYGTWFNIAAVPFFLTMGIQSFKSKQQVKKEAAVKKSFYSGILVSILNPLQIPFWIVWNSYFLKNGWITKDFFLLNFYVLGTGIGALLFLSLVSYIAGKYRLDASKSLYWMNKGVGLFFILCGCAQAFKVWH